MNRSLPRAVRSAFVLSLVAGSLAVAAQPDAAKHSLPAAKQPATDTKPAKPEKDDKKPKKADEPAPAGLKVGDAAPADAALIDIDGKPVKLKDLWKDGPVVITFYRGGWCPFCTRALSGWVKKLDDLKAAGGTFVAITPETPDEVKTTKEKSDLSATVLVDDKSEAGKGFKVHFELDDDTRAKYKGFGVDLEKRNQNKKWELDAPATFVIDSAGIVRYVFADWDYKKRADPDKVIAAVKELTKKK